MANFSFAGTFTSLPDPDYQAFGVPMRGAFVGGGLVYQGLESAILKFAPLDSAARNELITRWQANNAGLVGGKLPYLSGTGGWQVVTAAWGQPNGTGWDGIWLHGITMTVYKIQRF